MESALARELIDAGVHFGHRTNRWNPKMAPYILGKRNGIHIINIRETVRGLLRARKFLSAVVSRGQDVLIVGTKRQARESVEKQANRVGMPFVAERWLGGTLTNFKTIRSRLARLDELEAAKSDTSVDISKKMQSSLERERKKIFRNLQGLRRMERLPGALVIIDVKREYIAVREARKLNIPTVCIVDTDSDPDTADVIIPGNDDAMRALEIIVTQLCESVEEGKRNRPAPGEQAAGEDGARRGGGRRSRRLTTSELAERETMAGGGGLEEPGMGPANRVPVESVAGSSAGDGAPSESLTAPA